MSLKYEVIGRNIRNARKRKNMTQEKAAELLDISLQHYGKLERGDRHINLPKLAEVSELFDIPLERLVEGAMPTPEDALPEIDAGDSGFLDTMQQLSKGCSDSALRLMLRLCASVADEDKNRNSH